MIERKLIIGLIVSTEFNERIARKWQPNLFQSSVAKRLATWSLEYYDKYKKAPNKEIETIFYKKIQSKNFSTDLAEEIEEDILPDLSNQYEGEGINIEYLVEEALKYFSERKLMLHADTIKAHVERGNLIDAENEVYNFDPIAKQSENWVDFSNEEDIDNAVEKAFEVASKPLIEYAGPLGDILNEHMVRGGFVAFMGKEKMGKTFTALDLSNVSVKHKLNVALFQAGDMTNEQQTMRLSIYHSRKSNKEKYCQAHYQPVKDCVYNQNNSCERKQRECDFGPFAGRDPKELRKNITYEELAEAYKEYPDYSPCTNCKYFYGTPWFKKIKQVDPLTKEEAKKSLKKFFIKNKRHFRISYHPSGTLTLDECEALLNLWERDGFVPDVIIWDYADIMTHPYTKDERSKQNSIWMGMRSLVQKKHALGVTFTQTDALAYDKDVISRKNFSEDKRKYAHCTAMFGLNEDSQGREKKIGVMRINEIVVREGDFDTTTQVTVLKNLRRGRPILTSYW